MLQIRARSALSEKLVLASVRKRCYPWDEATIDWTVPLDDEHLYLPEEYSLFYGTPVWNRLSPTDKSFVTRWEFTQLMRNAGAGEHLLNQGILALLHHTNQYDAGWRFMLHEVAEECQHMAMFNTWVRLNPDIRTKGLNDDAWGLWASMLLPVFATRFPVLFWAATILLEVAGDDMARAQARNACGQVHPIVRQMGRAHQIEESRHIAFARGWVREGVPRMSNSSRVAAKASIETLAGRALAIGFAPAYGRQLAPYVGYKEFKAAVHSGHRRELLSRQLYGPLQELQGVGLVGDRAIRRWKRNGLLSAASGTGSRGAA